MYSAAHNKLASLALPRGLTSYDSTGSIAIDRAMRTHGAWVACVRDLGALGVVTVILGSAHSREVQYDPPRQYSRLDIPE